MQPNAYSASITTSVPCNAAQPKPQHNRWLRTALHTLCLTALVSCGGGGGGSTTGSVGDDINSSTGLPNSFGGSSGSGFGRGDSGADGTAGQGAPLVGAAITITDVAGRSVTAVTDAQGYYAAKVTNFTSPLVAKALSSNGQVLYYSLSTAPVTTGTFVTVNMTGLTDKIASDVAVAAGGNGPANLTPQQVAQNLPAVASAKANLRTLLGTQLAASGLNAATFDPITLPFRPNGSGYDAVLDTTLVTRNGSGTTQITPNGQQRVAGLDTSGIAVFVSEFNRLNKLQSTRSGAAFANLVDVDYLDGGENKAAFLASFSSGTDTLAGNLTNVGYKNCNATTAVCDFAFDFVQTSGRVFSPSAQKVKLTAGVWRLYGNRIPVDFGFSSVLEKKTNVALGNAVTYSAGYNFYLNTANFGSAKIAYTLTKGTSTSAPVELMRLIAVKGTCTSLGTAFLFTDNGNLNDCGNLTVKTDAELAALNTVFASGVVNLIVTGYSAGNYTGTVTTFTDTFKQVLRLASEGPTTATPSVSTGSGRVTSATFTVPPGFSTDSVWIDVRKQFPPNPSFQSGQTRFGGSSLAALGGTVTLEAAYSTCVAGGGPVSQCTASYGPADNAQISSIFIFGQDSSGRGIWTSYAFPFQ